MEGFFLTPPKRVTLPTWGTLPPRKQALRSNDATATRTSLKKWICLPSRLFLPINFVKCRWTLLKVSFKGPYPSSERDWINFRRCLLKISIKRKIRHFLVVVVQKRQRHVQKLWWRCKVVVLLVKPFFFFLKLSLRSRHWSLGPVYIEVGDPR